MAKAHQAFNLASFKPLFQDERKDLVYLARTAETAERYEDMCQFMRELVTWLEKQPGRPDLTVEEKNLLSVAYKNVIGARRATWRSLNGDDRKDEALIMEYRKQIEQELQSVCNDVVDLLSNVLLKNQNDANEARVFYLKMAGDYYRYLAEFVHGKSYEQLANQSYTDALAIATVKLPTTHPIRLGLALNCSVCHYEILKDKQSACNLAKKAFDEAISHLEELDEASYKDSTLIMQLLRDNLTLWTSETANEEDAA